MIFPTDLAKRRAEYKAVLESEAVDSSRFFTQKKLMDVCERAARRAGLLTGRTPSDAERQLLLAEAAEASRFGKNQPLARLSVSAKMDLLKQLIEKTAFLSENEAALTDWLLAHEVQHKLHGLGQLLKTWRMVCVNQSIADRFTVNTALLQLIETGELPDELSGDIQFRAVRWFNPFEERFVGALKRRLGPQKVHIISVLPPAHAEAAEDRLGAVVRSELQRGNEEEWTAWLEDFADAFEADDSNILAEDSGENISFFVSSNPYGEIEDAARRIACDIEAGIPPHEIVLILRDLSPYTDIVPDVFRRFGIPIYFRRGTPAAAHPPVKTLLALLAFPRTLSRDRLCDLLLLPDVDWPGVENREALVQELRKKSLPRLAHLPKELQGFFQGSSFPERVQFILSQHRLELPDEVHKLIQELGEAPLPARSMEQMISLFEELLENVTLQDGLSTENGVWIINPMDAAGLRFKSVYLAGMDDRTFPKIPKASGVLNLADRTRLKAFLTERKIACPRLALSETGEALIQEEILFLTAMSTATQQLTLSFTQSDADGKERAPGEFFERVRMLTGGGSPVRAESFHTILPASAIRAKDEARQTAAHFSIKPKNTPHFPAEQIKPMIFQWLEKHPEFSATALESLARNHYVFFLEKVLGIRADRTHEDDTDPMDRGTLVHDILELVYVAIAEQSDLYAQKSSPSSSLGTGNGWKLSQSGEIPLAVFDSAKSDELLALARKITDEEFAKAERRPSRHLGHPAVWETEKRKLHQVVENFVRMDIETAQNENRYPALFELKFDEIHELPVTLKHDGEEVRLKGKIDRIDLIFDEAGNLERLLVVDYKSKNRKDNVETIQKKTALNLDCQLALYTFAAQQKFFGELNTPELNEKVQAAYHLQERSLKEMKKHFGKKRLTMTPELTAEFLETLFSNVRKLRAGDLATEPLIAGYEDYSHICRTVAHDAKDLLNAQTQQGK